MTHAIAVRTLLVCRAVHRALLLCAPEPPGRDPDLPDQLVPTRNRVSFAKLDEVLPLPDLVAIQRESFDWLLNEGIKEVLEEVSPIEDFTEQFQLYFGRHEFREQKFSEEECRDKDITFSRPLFVIVSVSPSSTRSYRFPTSWASSGSRSIGS